MACQRSKSQDVSAATWNVNSMVGRSGEVVDALHRRKIDFCCTVVVVCHDQVRRQGSRCRGS